MYRQSETIPNFEICNIPNIPLQTPVGNSCIIKWFGHNVAPTVLVEIFPLPCYIDQMVLSWNLQQPESHQESHILPY